MSFNLDYFYGNETEQFRFYRIPKVLFNEDLSLEAVTLYGLMLDRVSLSIQNSWTDDQGRVYIYFVQTDVQKHLRCGHNRATTFMRELESFGLIERKRQGLGKPAKIYVKNPAACEDVESNCQESALEDTMPQNQKSVFSFAQKGAFKTAQNERSGVPTAGDLECPNQAANDTEKKETEFMETNPILPQPPRRYRKTSQPGKTSQAQIDEMRWVREQIRENIDYERLILDHFRDQEIFDGYVELMTEAACSSKEHIRICGQELPTALVRSRFLKLERDHIEYVRDCLSRTTSAIGNIKAYTLAALYNAPVTIGQYYTALVSRDMA